MCQCCTQEIHWQLECIVIQLNNRDPTKVIWCYFIWTGNIILYPALSERRIHCSYQHRCSDTYPQCLLYLWPISIHTDILLIHPIRIGNITSASTCNLRDMDNDIMEYFFEETRSWRDIHINIDAPIPTVSGYICDQFQYIRISFSFIQ